MAYIKGNFRKYIFRSDKDYVVGLFKVKESDLDLKSSTITFTGYFGDLNESDNYLFNGEIVSHDKYGEQFSVSSYEVLLPDDKDHIIDLGPEGGDGGGQVVAVGTPEQICKNEQSYTGKFLKKYLE